MTIRTYNPSLSVMLYKLVQSGQQGTSQRYQGAQAMIDLTPYLGDTTSIQVQKNLQNPVGTWSISIPDQPDSTTADTLYSLIEPMDVVIIRATRQGYKYAGGTLPLLMRGFVSSVRRGETMGPNEPQRSVVISGEDWGKLWLIHGVWMEVAIAQDLPLLSTFQLQAAIGMVPGLAPVGDFMKQVTNDVINRKIAALAAFEAPGVLKQFTCNPTVTQGSIVPQAVGLFSPGPFWSLVKNFSDFPWNEIWIDDSDSGGPELVFRPTPFQDINGIWLNGSKDPGTILLDQSDITAIEVGRSDANVANFFWTPPGQTMMDTPNGMQAWDITQGNPFDFQHPNDAPDLYGYRKMEWPTQLVPDTLAAYPLRQTPEDQVQSASQISDWHIARGQALRDMNRDNVLFEDGVIRARGREDFRPGQYLQVTRNQVTWRAYLTQIFHSIQPFGDWQTTLQISRGTGFIVRRGIQGSPFWAEGRPSVYASPKGSVTVTDSAAPAPASPDANGGLSA